MDWVPEGFSSLKDYEVSPAYTSIDWAASYPNAYVGDAKKATWEKGKRIIDAQKDRLVELIRKVKKDDKVLIKIKEFNKQIFKP